MTLPRGDSVALVPDFVVRRPSGRYRALNPMTKLTIAFVEALVAFGVRGWSGPLFVLAVLAVTAAVAGLGRRLIPFALATIPIVASILLVNTLLYPGAVDRIATIGPLEPTWTGLAAALQATLRVVAFALSAAVLGLTTTTDDLVADLERRGLGRRGAYVIGSAIRTVPRMVERAGEIVEAQRARGLDTEGSWPRRIRGVVPLAGPMVLGAFGEVEERTMALEARAFSAPGRRTVLRVLPDDVVQRSARWLMLLGSVAVTGASLAGLLAIP